MAERLTVVNTWGGPIAEDFERPRTAGCRAVLRAGHPAPLSDDDATELARVLAALADPVRLRLLSLVASQTEICSCNLEGPLGKSQPTISHHTRVLAEAGLLVGEKRGRWTWWRVEPGRLAAVRAALGG